MSKAQILQQAGTSVLAQANRVPQNVLFYCVNPAIDSPTRGTQSRQRKLPF